MFYCTPTTLQQNTEVRKRAMQQAANYPLESPSSDEWQRWVKSKFYTSVVFPFFDLGDLAFCPDRRKEKRWKDLFGKNGLLKSFSPIFYPEDWEGSWLRVNACSFKYLYQAEGILERAAEDFPLPLSRCFRDAIDYRWGTDFLIDFQRSLGFSLWSAGVVQEDGESLSPFYGSAAKRMIILNG